MSTKKKRKARKKRAKKRPAKIAKKSRASTKKKRKATRRKAKPSAKRRIAKGVGKQRVKKRAKKAKKTKKRATKTKRVAARRSRVIAASFSGDGRVLGTSVGKRIYIWDVAGKPKKRNAIPTQVEASRIALDRDGSRVAAAVAGFSEVRVRSTTTGALLHEVRARAAVTCFAFAPDGRFVLGEVDRIGEDGLHARSFVTVIDLATGAEQFRTPILDLPIREIAFSTDGLLLFLGFGGGIVVVFDLESKRELFRFPSVEGADIGQRIAAAFAFSKDGRRAAICWGDVVEVWPVEGGDAGARIDLGARAWSVALSKDGKHVIAGAPASGVWSLDGKKVASIDVGHNVIADPEGKRVLVGDRIDLAKGPALAPTSVA